MKQDVSSEVKVGETYVIDEIHAPPAIARRFMEMGLLSGVSIKCAHIAPSGSPIAFWVTGALIAIRRSDRERISVSSCA